MVCTLNLSAVDEVISARKTLHGGTVGAPTKLNDGSREGDALNRAATVLLTSSLQAYIGDVFQACSNKAFGRDLIELELKNYQNTWSRWGNPSASNIINLFRRLGVDDVFDGLSWRNQSTKTLKGNLNTINEVRNKIAHGQLITVGGNPYQLRLSGISRWRNISEQFGNRFEAHALGKVR